MYPRISSLLVFVWVLVSGVPAHAALTKTFLGSDVTGDATPVTEFAVTVDSTGQTHVVCFVKHEGSATTITIADNKGSGAFNLLTKVDHSNNGLSSRLAWVKIGSPGTSHTITATYGAGKTYSRMACWGINSGTGDIALDVEASASGNGTAVDAGSLATTAATVSFMGVGESTGTAYTPSTGWTEDLDSSIYGASRADASGTLDPACTSDASMDWTSNAASFNETGGGGGSVRRGMLLGVGP